MTLTRRAWLAASGLGHAAPTPLDIPICLIQDSRAIFEKERIAAFWRSIWPQAIRNLGHCGIRPQVRRVAGEVKRLPSGRPSFAGLERGMLNVVVTNQIPLAWDNGRGLNGVTTLHQGFHLCMVAVHFAHGHQMPFVSVNTCLHELCTLSASIFSRTGPEAPRVHGASFA